jgi:hypothetical protein
LQDHGARLAGFEAGVRLAVDVLGQRVSDALLDQRGPHASVDLGGLEPLEDERAQRARRGADDDYIYRDEVERFVAEGVLQTVRVASSRRRPERREYVQDRIRQEGELVWRLLDDGAYVYVCGSRPMREAVRAAFVDVVAEHGARTDEEAEMYLQELEATENRYRPDVWG